MARKNTKKVNAANPGAPVKSAAPVKAAEVKEPALEAVPVKEEPVVKEEAVAEEKAVVEEKVSEEVKEAVQTEKEPKKRGRKSGVKNKVEKAPEKEVKEAEKTENIIIQTAGMEYDAGKIAADVRAAWVAEGHRESSIKKLNIYINMDERKAYYVINDKNTGYVEL